MIIGRTFADQQETSASFAHFKNTFLLGESGITKGCNVSADAKSIYITAGSFIVYGRTSEIVGTEEIEVGMAESGELFCVLVYEIDLSKTNTVEEFNQGTFRVLTSPDKYPDLIKEDLDSSGKLYQFEFARCKKTVSGIQNFNDTSVKISVSEVWARVARQNQQYRDEFEAFYEKQKQEIVTETGKFSEYRQQYEQNVKADYEAYVAFMDAQKETATKYFDVEKTDFDAFFDVQKKKIEDMIAELYGKSFVTNARFDETKEDLTDKINGFCSKTTTFNADGSISETDSVGNVKITSFLSNGDIQEQLTKADGSITTKTTHFNADGSITEVVSK